MSGGTNQRNGSLSRVERERRGLEHTWITVLGHILSPPDSTGVGMLKFKDLSYTHFPAALGRSILKKGSNVG